MAKKIPPLDARGGRELPRTQDDRLGAVGAIDPGATIGTSTIVRAVPALYLVGYIRDGCATSPAHHLLFDFGRGSRVDDPSHVNLLSRNHILKQCIE